MASSEPYIASVDLWPVSWAPKNWALCQGQLLAIATNQALFSLLGTTYGGDGRTTFALPDFRGRLPVGMGQGPGLENIVLGQMSGTNNTTLLVSNLPMHNHLINANNTASGRSTQVSPATNFIGQNQDGSGNYASTGNAVMNVAAVHPSGGNQPVSITQPFLGICYIIALFGIFPSRN